MIKFCVLGSGSSGNAIYFDCDGFRFLIDCGFSKKELGKRLATIGRDVADISAVFVTHDHGDHKAKWLEKSGMVRGFEPAPDGYDYGSCHIEYFKLQHDSLSVGYHIRDNSGNRVAVICDTGCVPEQALPYLFDCSAILIECNYDVDLLVNGPYSTERQERIASDHGHLMNEDAAAAVECVVWGGLQHVVGLHLSGNNNRPEFARLALRNAVRVSPGCQVWVAEQKMPGKLITII